MSGTRSSKRCVSGSVFSALAVVVVFALQAAAQIPGRFLSTSGDSVLECNIDGSNCLTVVDNGSGGGSLPAQASSPSVANNGTIAFDAIYGADGTCIAAFQGICPPHLFLMDADGTNVRQITFNPSPIGQYSGDKLAAISPDGTMVAFISRRNPAPDGVTYMDQLYVVNVDGSNLRQLTAYQTDGNGNSFGQAYSAAWSPDSKTLAYQAYVYTAFCGTFFGQPEEFGVVGEINADGSGGTYVACGSHNGPTGPAVDWSPDGTLIAYSRLGLSDPAIVLIDPSGHGRYALTSTELGDNCGGAHCIHFSPDSTRLAYQNASNNISIINLDGTGRNDTTVPFGSCTAAFDVHCGLWWAPGPALPAASQVTLAPDPVEVWPGSPQQLFPTLLDANGSLILHTAAVYNKLNDYSTDGVCLQIGPYGLASSLVGRNYGSGTISVTNESLLSNSVSYKCWTSSPCTFTLGSTSTEMPASGGSGVVGVTADAGSSGSSCPWAAASNASWIIITSRSSGSGNGSIGFTVSANTGGARQGTMTIAGSTYSVNQDAGGAVTLQSIIVTPNSASAPAGLTLQFAATGQYSDGSNKVLTASVTWSSSNTAVATVSNTSGTQGLATGVMVGGPVTITALLTGVSGTAQLTVTAPTLQSITVSPAMSSVAAGLSQQFIATGHYSDSSTQTLTTSVTWSSSNTSIATISNSSGAQGLATGVNTGGPVTIAALLGGVTGTAQLTVTAPVLQSLAITPANPTVLSGTTQQFNATGTYSDGSTQNITGGVTWASSNTAVATINASGLASAFAAGAATISAKQGSVSNSTAITVITLQLITITPANASLFPGSTLQFTATGKYSDSTTRDLTSTAVWTSSKTMVATITSPGGVATAVGKGTTTIKGTVGGVSGVTTLTVPPALQSISVSPATATIAAGATQQFLATGNYSDGTTKDVTNSVAWSSSSKQVASVSAGLAKGIKAGTATISAKSGAVTGSAALTVQ